MTLAPSSVVDAVAIDGPASSGKSTLAREVAKRLGFAFVDTGSLYRAVALTIDRAGAGELPEEDPLFASALKGTAVTIEPTPSGVRVFLSGEDVTALLREERLGRIASRVSSFPSVRKALFDLQRTLALAGKIVMDGRDIGSVILPEARLKIFLVADPEVRAKRRLLDLERTGQKASFDTVLSDINERDDRDRNRKIAPLVQAPGAILLDTSSMTVIEAVDWIVAHYR